MSQVISLLHDKGGCAKTTTCVNLGFALWLLGKKVLLVDTDPQCNLTDTVDKTVHLEAESTIYIPSIADLYALRWSRLRAWQPQYEQYQRGASVDV